MVIKPEKTHNFRSPVMGNYPANIGTFPHYVSLIEKGTSAEFRLALMESQHVNHHDSKDLIGLFLYRIMIFKAHINSITNLHHPLHFL